MGCGALDVGLMKADNYKLNAWYAQHLDNYKFVKKERDKELSDLCIPMTFAC